MYITNSKVSVDATGGCNSCFSIDLNLLLISTAQNIMNLNHTINKKRERWIVGQRAKGNNRGAAV
jgi:hypothetical protein